MNTYQIEISEYYYDSPAFQEFVWVLEDLLIAELDFSRHGVSFNVLVML